MKKLFVSIMMAFAMVFACVITPFNKSKVKAQETFITYDKVYYVTNNPNASSYRQSLLTFPDRGQINIHIRNIYLYYDQDFETAFDEFQALTSVSDAYVIVEMINGFDSEIINDPMLTLADEFYTTFRNLKNDDCQILFICGTDETRLMNPDNEDDAKNQFLQYVDFHVNTDMITTFLYNIFNRVEEDIGVYPTNVVYILDSFFAQGLNLTVDFSGWFFTTYFVPYLEEIYANEMIGYTSIADFLDAKRIKFLCYYGIVYIDVVRGQGVATINEIGEFLDNYEHIYAIGSSNCLYEEDEPTTVWGDAILEMRTFTGKEFPVYILDFHNAWQSDLDNDLYTVNHSIDVYQHILDFLSPNSDVCMYYFWSGLCQNTHKHCITAESGGWIADTYANGYYIGSWKIDTTT